jgi:hypothetical protein
MSPDPNAEAEASAVVNNLQTGEYVFLDNEARKIIDNNGCTLLEKFLTHKQLYLTWPSVTKSELIVSAFLESVTEARIRGVLIDKKARSYFLMVDDETEKTVNKLINKINLLNTLCKNKFGCALFVNDAKLMLNLKHPVGNEPEYVFRIETIACIIDNIYREDITKRIQTLASLQKSDEKIGSITMIEALLKEKGIHPKEPIKMLRNLNTLFK